MLLDRSKPSVNQSFGDYLEALGKRNGFRDLHSFKAYLQKKSKSQYQIFSSYNRLFALINGLFLELGIDRRPDPDNYRFVCFRCVDGEPKRWNWQAVERELCYDHFGIRSIGVEPEVIRNRHCGLTLCTAKRLGLPYRSKKEGLFFADMYSINERNELDAPRIYPKYMAFLQV